jgi:BirA family transcriptional regulator, biotin operon repressor / biotin---[acetyl-CoA-carboxylase] ligase
MLTNGDRNRALILAALREREGAVSGEALAGALRASRVAVWRHVRTLQGLGYPITAGRRGYALAGDPDSLAPWELPDLPLVWRAEAASTMDLARRLAARSPARDLVVAADRQTNGRGRNGRAWSSFPGGIYATFLRRDRIPAAFLPRIAAAASVAVARCLERIPGLAPSVKWPNDVLLGRHKVAGVLVEADARGDLLEWYAVGVGVNVTNRPRTPGAVSVDEAARVAVSRRSLFVSLCEEIARALDTIAAPGLPDQWSRLSGPARSVVIATPFGSISGTARGIDEWGALVVRRGDGSLVHVPSGDCVHGKEVS